MGLTPGRERRTRVPKSRPLNARPLDGSCRPKSSARPGALIVFTHSGGEGSKRNGPAHANERRPSSRTAPRATPTRLEQQSHQASSGATNVIVCTSGESTIARILRGSRIRSRMPGPEHGAQARGLAEEQDERATLGERLFLSVSLSLSLLLRRLNFDSPRQWESWLTPRFSLIGDQSAQFRVLSKNIPLLHHVRPQFRRGALRLRGSHTAGNVTT